MIGGPHVRRVRRDRVVDERGRAQERAAVAPTNVMRATDFARSLAAASAGVDAGEVDVARASRADARRPRDADPRRGEVGARRRPGATMRGIAQRHAVDGRRCGRDLDLDRGGFARRGSGASTAVRCARSAAMSRGGHIAERVGRAEPANRTTMPSTGLSSASATRSAAAPGDFDFDTRDARAARGGRPREVAQRDVARRRPERRGEADRERRPLSASRAGASSSREGARDRCGAARQRRPGAASTACLARRGHAHVGGRRRDIGAVAAGTGAISAAASATRVRRKRSGVTRQRHRRVGYGFTGDDLRSVSARLESLRTGKVQCGHRSSVRRADRRPVHPARREAGSRKSRSSLSVASTPYAGRARRRRVLGGRDRRHHAASARRRRSPARSRARWSTPVELK